MSSKTEWFSTWFDTKYYHILYQNRDYTEAELFINNLINHLKPVENSSFLDLACGKGRHSIFLNKKGFNVLGSDLSEQSILAAQQSENATLKFKVQDMRIPLEDAKFDYILNLFTSFGYFENDSEDQEVLNSVATMLHPKGIFVLDYLNIDKLINDLIPFEIKTIDGIDFELKRYFENGFITKEISFKDNSEKFHFQEKVKALDITDFERLFKKAHLKVKHVFGDYELNDFNSETSNRMIFVVEK